MTTFGVVFVDAEFLLKMYHMDTATPVPPAGQVLLNNMGCQKRIFENIICEIL